MQDFNDVFVEAGELIVRVQPDLSVRMSVACEDSAPGDDLVDRDATREEVIAAVCGEWPKCAHLIDEAGFPS